MSDCRVIPRRAASWSSWAKNSFGKSILIRLPPRPWRRALLRSRYWVTSSLFSSTSRSNSSALIVALLIEFSFLRAHMPHRNQPNFFPAHREHAEPQFFFQRCNPADSTLIVKNRIVLDIVFRLPQCFSLFEIDS